MYTINDYAFKNGINFKYFLTIDDEFVVACRTYAEAVKVMRENLENRYSISELENLFGDYFRTEVRNGVEYTDFEEWLFEDDTLEWVFQDIDNVFEYSIDDEYSTRFDILDANYGLILQAHADEVGDE